MDQRESCIQLDMGGGLGRLGWVTRGYKGILGRRNRRNKSVKELMGIAGERDSERISLITERGLTGSSEK